MEVNLTHSMWLHLSLIAPTKNQTSVLDLNQPHAVSDYSHQQHRKVNENYVLYHEETYN